MRVRIACFKFVAAAGAAGNQRDIALDRLLSFAACQINAVDDGCIVNRKNSDESIDFAPLSTKIWTIAPLVSFFFIGINYIVGNYAGTMSIIELYAMGATFGIALFKWVDWIQGYPAPKRIKE